MLKNHILISTAVIFLFLPIISLHPAHATDPIDNLINTMTLEEKIGQIMLIGFQGMDLDRDTIALFRKIRPGGIVFYGRNFREADTAAMLIGKIQVLFGKNPLPLFFAIDQEGGIVHRIRGTLHRPPSAPAIGAAGSEQLAHEVGLSVGSALRGIGININMAPVLDVLYETTSPSMARRSFGSNPLLVKQLGASYIQGLRDAGVMAVAKHFPGVGKAAEDSHHVLPHITWNSPGDDVNLLPFSGAVESGVDMIMPGHVIVAPGDARNPVSLSPFWIKDVLRGKMGFRGLVVIDNIEMKAIEGMMPLSTAAIRSFKAGADLIMVSHEKKNQEAVFSGLVSAVQGGEISAERLDESLRRIIRAKQDLKSFHSPQSSVRGLEDVTESVAEISVKLIKTKNAPDLHTGAIRKVLYAGYNPNMLHALKAVLVNTDHLNTPLPQHMRTENPMSKRLRNADLVLVEADYPDVKALLTFCAAMKKRCGVILGHPWEASRVMQELGPDYLIAVPELTPAFAKRTAEMIVGSEK